jgi:hypothetical protein
VKLHLNNRKTNEADVEKEWENFLTHYNQQHTKIQKRNIDDTEENV